MLTVKIAGNETNAINLLPPSPPHTQAINAGEVSFYTTPPRCETRTMVCVKRKSPSNHILRDEIAVVVVGESNVQVGKIFSFLFTLGIVLTLAMRKGNMRRRQ
ncbi:hypothetical protein EGR_06594 [Echinococcus granulosus]|uniref:Uncharacterized protein n=1 Tax=Echinococcus granulosus TaxID=6210 RepID=W6UKI3_ECHGR|nr:hypothetical protein EGR_06594 [Echinococcus granulosus]EUB58607.1 hypothetical protein EGR_06594 [Echinococcus granulosus]